MKYLHIHVGVERIEDGIGFYSALFGVEPVKVKPDYAKWVVEELQVSFAISTRVAKNGVDHLGIQVDTASELEVIRARMTAAAISTYDEGDAVCCYAKSEKSWAKDPSGVAWETYRSIEDVPVYANDARGACCDSDAQHSSDCCN